MLRGSPRASGHFGTALEREISMRRAIAALPNFDAHVTTEHLIADGPSSDRKSTPRGL